ncbi:MAG: tetratricopeptide repeat protein [Nitrospirae bacterium]|nr:tetratricopeptide repeat protein [Nitrospirota bacterium]
MKANRNKSKGTPTGASGGWGPDNPILIQAMNVAATRHREGKLAEAEQICHDVLKRDPKHPEAMVLLAMIAHQTGRHEEALKTVRSVLKHRARHAGAWFVAAGASLALGRVREAEQACRTLLKLAPDHPAGARLTAALAELKRSAG